MEDAFRTVWCPFFNVWTFVQFLFIETGLFLPNLFVVLSFATSMFELVAVDQLGIEDAFATEACRCVLQKVQMAVEIYRYHQQGQREDILKEQEAHADDDAFLTSADAPERSDGAEIIVLDERIERGDYRENR